MIRCLVIIFILVESCTVLSYNVLLNNFDENLLYSHIKTKNDLDLFYQKLIKTTNIDHLKVKENLQVQNNIRDLNLKDQVIIQ